MRTGTNDKAVVQHVCLPSSRTETWGMLPGSPAVCAPVSWRVSPGVLAVWAALASGLLFRFCVWVWSHRVFLALFCCLVSSSGSVSKRGNDPGQRPKDRFFSDRPTTCRAGSPWWPGVRGDDPRTDVLAGTPFYVRHYSGIGGGCWVLTLVFFVASSFFVFSSFARLFKPTGGGWWKNLHV